MKTIDLKNEPDFVLHETFRTSIDFGLKYKIAKELKRRANERAEERP